MTAPADDAELLARARTGDRTAFDALAAPHVPRLRSFLHRLVAHPDDAEDLAQDAMLQAFRKLAGFRADSAFSTWLFTIAHRLALTHLRTCKQRWPATIQLEMHDRAGSSAEFGVELAGEMSRPEFRYEVAEHIAYCFSCIARSLDPEDSAALVLREVLDLPNREAARIVDLSESAFRHRLASARRTMTEAFDGLCALINKQGACHQCSTLRGLCPPERRGPPVEPLGDVATGDPDALLDRRLAAVRGADVVAGSTAGMHAVMLRFIARHADPPTSSDS